MLRQTKPDVIGVQELTDAMKPYMYDILKKYQLAGESRGSMFNDEYSAVLFRSDRFTLLDQDTFWLSPTPKKKGSKLPLSQFPRIVTYVHLYDKTEQKDFTFFNTHLPASAAWASFGFAIFGVGYEMTGITVSKAMVRWFTGHELALAMGLQLAMARFGTAAALSISAPIARHYTLSAPLLVALAFLIIGLLAFLVFCVMDRRLDHRMIIASDEHGLTRNDQDLRENPCLSDANKDSEEFRFSDIGTTLRSPGFWLITLFCVLFYSAVSPFLKFSTKLMVMKYGVDPDVAGFFSSIAPFGTILMTPLFGLIYDRYGKGVTLVITGALMLTAVHFGFSLPMHSSTVAITLMVILSVGFSLAPAALWPCVPKIIPLKCLGTACSMIFFIQNFGRAIIPMFVGKANETDPTYETSMLIFGFTALGATLTAMAMWYVDRRQGYGLQLPNIRK
jgi:nitrate/nitrite transporter NarK